MVINIVDWLDKAGGGALSEATSMPWDWQASLAK